ncbi:hypothetical protein [Clostridium sp. HV4-5-A1G]|nr:hypothetical protein [Clostridium sp. HV4-5-A1G]
MCKVGDIILIRNYQSEGVKLGQNLFIVINDKHGGIKELSLEDIADNL